MRLFLLPGLRGAIGEETELTRRFGRLANIELIDYPGLSAPVGVLTSITAIARSVTCHIARRQPVGPVFIWGGSFGGCVAYDVAAALHRSGRDVALMLIDPPFGGVSSSAWKKPGPARYAARELFGVASRIDITRRLLVRLGRSYPAVSRFLEGYLRRRAISRWRPSPTNVPRICVLASEEFFRTTREVLGRLAPQASIVVAPGQHGDVFGDIWWDHLEPVFLRWLNYEG